MRYRNPLVRLFVLCLSLCLITGCTPPEKTNIVNRSETKADQAVTLFPGYVEMAISKSLKLLAKAPANSKMIWKSSVPSIAAVDADGTVHSLKVGDAQITASLSNSPTASATCTIHVLAKGSTLAYGIPPNNPAGSSVPDSAAKEDSSSPGNANTSENSDNVPVEVDDGSNIPVIVDPMLDHFTWTIAIDDTWDIDHDGMVSTRHLQLKAVKQGGKDPFGTYSFTGKESIGIKSAKVMEDIQKDVEADGGRIQINNTTESLIKSGSLTLVPYKRTGSAQSNPKADPSGVAHGIADGKFIIQVKSTTSMSISDSDGSGASSKTLSTERPIEFQLIISKDGSARLMLDTTKEPMFFNGKLTKKPLRN